METVENEPQMTVSPLGDKDVTVGSVIMSAPSGGGVDPGGSWAFVRAGSRWEMSASSSSFCCDLKQL